MTRKQVLLVLLATFTGLVGGFFGMSFFFVRKRISPDIRKFKRIIAAIAETIIPQTETPGAKTAHVDDYIVRVMTNCYSIKKQHAFVEGLQSVENYAMKHHSNSFSSCSYNERQLILQHFERQRRHDNTLLGKIEKKLLGDSFFQQIRWLTVSGYCTSLAGATQGLAYDAIPVDFIACSTYAPGQKSWATK